LVAELAAGLPGVILIILLQSLIVRCGDAGGLKPQPRGFIEGAAGRYIAGAAERDNHQ